jgi:hypothetical protein
MVESKDVGIEAADRLDANRDFQFIEFSLVPIEWIQKLYPDSWEKYQLRRSDVELNDG